MSALTYSENVWLRVFPIAVPFDFSVQVHLKVPFSVSFSDIYSSLISNCFRTQFNPDIRPVNWSLIACGICIVIDASFLGLRCLVIMLSLEIRNEQLCYLWFFNYVGNTWHENQNPSGRNFRNEFPPLTDCRSRQSKMSSQICSIHIGCNSVFRLNDYFHTKSQNKEMLSTFNHALFTLSSTLNKTRVKLALLCKASTP